MEQLETEIICAAFHLREKSEAEVIELLYKEGVADPSLIIAAAHLYRKYQKYDDDDEETKP